MIRDPIDLMIALTVGLILGWLATGCPAPVCPTLATRCADATHVEVCDSEGQWQPVADCSTLWETAGGEWTCAETDEDGERVHACLPAEPSGNPGELP